MCYDVTEAHQRTVSLILLYPNSYGSAQRVKWWVVCDSRSKPIDSLVCASCNPFEVLHLDHIRPLTKDANGNEYILVIIDAFSRWVELFPTKSTTAAERAYMILNHVGRLDLQRSFILTKDRPSTMNWSLNSFATAYSSEENRIVERANQEVLWHLRAFLFDSRVQDASLDPQRTQVVTENLFQYFPEHFSSNEWNLPYLRILTSRILLVPILVIPLELG